MAWTMTYRIEGSAIRESGHDVYLLLASADGWRIRSRQVTRSGGRSAS